MHCDVEQLGPILTETDPPVDQRMPLSAVCCRRDACHHGGGYRWHSKRLASSAGADCEGSR